MSAVTSRVEHSGVQMYLEVTGEEGSVPLNPTIGPNPTAPPQFDPIEDLSARVQRLANRIKENSDVFEKILSKYKLINLCWSDTYKIVRSGRAVRTSDGYRHSDFVLGRLSPQCAVLLSELNQLVRVRAAQEGDKKAARTDFYKWMQKNPGFRDDQDLIRKVDNIAALLQVTDSRMDGGGVDQFPNTISQLKEAIMEGIPRDELEILEKMDQNKEEVEKQSCCVIC